MKKDTAIITGANRGIGFATALKIAEKGYRVILACRSLKSAIQASDKVIKTLGLSKQLVIPLSCDLTKQESIDQMCLYISENIGKIEVLINNAAVLLDKNTSLLDMTMSVFMKTFESNVFGACYLTSKIIPQMISSNHGKIVMVSSGAGKKNELIDDMPAYRLSKYTLNGLVMMFAGMIKNTNVMIHAFDPGWVKTEMGGKNAIRTAEEAAGDIVDLVETVDEKFSGCFVRAGEIEKW